MDTWDIDAVELTGPAFIELEADGLGSFRFIAVEAQVNWRNHQATDRLDFTWEGNDEGDRVSGRGWAQVEEDGSLRGNIQFHLGDDSGFRAVRASSPLHGGDAGC
jgi:hypothetical protein